MKHYRPSKQTEDEKIHWVISQLKESKGDFKREIEALTEVYNMLITQQAFEFSHDIFKKFDHEKATRQSLRDTDGHIIGASVLSTVRTSYRKEDAS